MIIDIHAHTTENLLWGLHTTRADIADLERLAEEHGINKIVLMATYFPFKKKGLTNKKLQERIKGKKLFSMFGSLDVMNNFEEGTRELREMLEEGQVCGIKLYPGYQKFRLGDERIFPIYELASMYKVPVAIHTGALHHCCSYKRRLKKKYKCGENFCPLDRFKDFARPREILPVAKAFSDVIFIASHLGNPHFFELRKVMSECPNVCTDISGQFVSSGHEDTAEYKEEIRKEIEQFLEFKDRLMFATDFPIQSYKDSVELVRSLGLTKKDEERIFYKNAQRVLGLMETD